MVAATIRTIFAQPGHKEVRAQVDLVASMLAGKFPAVAQMLLDAKTDLTRSRTSGCRTGARSGAPTPYRAATARSSEGPRSSGSSPSGVSISVP